MSTVVLAIAVIGDRIAWLTEKDGDGLLDGQPSQLFIADVDTMLE